MVDPIEYAEVHYDGALAGAVIWDDRRRVATFEYDPAFVALEIELAPLTMPAGPGRFQFPELGFDAFRGLPGLLADSLPDRFGNSLIDAWVTRQGRTPASFSPIERLCYVGTRGMGALEYQPPTRIDSTSQRVQIDQLAELAATVMQSRAAIDTSLDDAGLAELLRVGTSAGGARAKAIIAWNPETDEVRSGQVAAPEGFEQWILKFDGVDAFDDRGLSQPQGYGRLEFAYHQMATAAGIDMNPCRLHVDRARRAHFMTKRFDRTPTDAKVHVQTLAALAHLDYNMAGAHSYEQAMAVTLQLCGAADTAQLYRRLVFNVVARNQDDHTKNIAFLMDRSGNWSLAPAHDVTWAFNPSGDWTSHHQMTINGKRDGFGRADLETVARQFGVTRSGDIIDEVIAAVAAWDVVATAAGVDEGLKRGARDSHRLSL